jgi:predicted flavoprotein YhiN
LQVSSYWREGAAVSVDWLAETPVDVLRARKRERPRAGLRSVLGDLLPQRLADAFLPDHDGRPIGEMPDRDLTALEDKLRRWTVEPIGTEGYAKAEVTLGGVDTGALSQRTMEARDVPGLFVIGEAVDVTGWLGGYNFQWAWSSGVAAGEAV